MAELIPTKELMRRNVAKNAAKTVLTDEEKKAVRAGASRAWYADLPGSVADLSGAALDYGAEGLARLLPSDLAGYDIPKSLGIRKFQQAMRNPAGGSKQLEKFGEQVGYIPPTTGTEMEERARLLAGLVDPVPGLPVGSVKQTKVFSSPAVKAVSEVKQEKMPANQWISQMKSRGVKQDEMTWTGVEDWLKSQDKSVTKQDLDEYLEANQIQVQEVVKGKPEEVTKINNEIQELETQIAQLQTQMETPVEIAGPFVESVPQGDKNSALIQKIQGLNLKKFELEKYAEVPKFKEHTLPGGENYRELLLTYKKPVEPNEMRFVVADGDKIMVGDDKLPYKEAVEKYAPNLAGATKVLDKLDIQSRNTAINDVLVPEIRKELGALKDSPSTDFVSDHYDEPNIVAHIRFNERVDADGNKVLFIEEIQSDWAQKGRKEGFLPDKSKRITELPEGYTKIVIPRGELFADQQFGTTVNKDTDRYVIFDSRGEQITSANTRESQTEVEALNYINDQALGTSQVPAAPFVMDTNQWTSLALKRMVRWATDNDFDQIAWTTGKQQAKRYDLSKQVDQISYKKNEDGTYVLLITPKGSNAALDTIQNQNMKSVPENKLEDIIGKELAKKIVNKEGEAFTNLSYMNEAKTQEDMTFRKFIGVDLEVGGEGMAGFYDKILVDRAKKLGKQYGSKVEKGELPQLKNIEIVEDQGGFIVNELSEDGTTVLNENFFETRDFAEEFARGLEQTGGGNVIDDPTVWTMNLTDKLKKAAKDGLPYYVALPPIVAGVASQQADASEVKKPAVQVKSNRILEEATQ